MKKKEINLSILNDTKALPDDIEVSESEKERIFEMSKRMYDIKKSASAPETRSADEVRGVEEYRHPGWYKAVSIAAAFVLAAAAITGSVLMIKGMGNAPEHLETQIEDKTESSAAGDPEEPAKTESDPEPHHDTSTADVTADKAESTEAVTAPDAENNTDSTYEDQPSDTSGEASPDKNDNKGGGNIFSEPNDQKVKTDDILNEKQDTGSANALKNIYPAKDIISKIIYCSGPNFFTFMYELNELYPIEYLAAPEGSAPYCIYQLDEGSRLFVFFDDREDGLRPVQYIFAVNEPLSKEDFAGLQEGMSLLDVEAVDPGTKLIDSIKIRSLRQDVTLHMVKEGFVKITYTGGDHYFFLAPESFRIRSIEFIPNGGTIDGVRFTFDEKDYPSR